MIKMVAPPIRPSQSIAFCVRTLACSDPENTASVACRANTVPVAKAETVIAVPSDIAMTAAIPAQKRSKLNARTRTKTAPVQGRMPIEPATAKVSHQD